jgi:tRNA U38,U39,U40 pseudouridine synthase TruA
MPLHSQFTPLSTDKFVSAIGDVWSVNTVQIKAESKLLERLSQDYLNSSIIISCYFRHTA